MAVSEILTTLGVSIAGGSLAGAAVIWLARTVISERIRNSIKHEYDTKLETLKADLASQNALNLERHKIQLSGEASQRHIQFSAIYVKREELLRTLHEATNQLLDGCFESTRPGSRNITPAAGVTFKKVHELMNEASIYFPEAFSDKWHKHTNELRKTLDEFLSERAAYTANSSADLKRSQEAYDQHIKAFWTLRTELRNEIRRWLGTSS